MAISAASLVTLTATEVSPRTAREKADDELANSKIAQELRTQRNHVINQTKYNRRANMLDLTSANLFLNSIPFWQDPLRTKLLPFRRNQTGWIYGFKGLTFFGAAIYYWSIAANAQNDADSADSLASQLDFQGRHEQASETAKFCLINFGIDAVTFLAIRKWHHLHYANSDKSIQMSSSSVIPLRLSVRSPRRSGREVSLNFQRSF